MLSPHYYDIDELFLERLEEIEGSFEEKKCREKPKIIDWREKSCFMEVKPIKHKRQNPLCISNNSHLP